MYINPYFTNMLPKMGAGVGAGVSSGVGAGADMSMGLGAGASVTPQQPMNWKPVSQAIAGAASGVMTPNPQDFSFDWAQAGISGLQGFAAGGPVGAAVGTVIGGAKQLAGIHRNAKNLDTSVDGVTTDIYGRPVYQGGNISQALSTADDLRQGEKSLKPFGLPTSALLRRRRRELMRNVAQAQESYNTADITHRDQMIQREQYLERLYR